MAVDDLTLYKALMSFGAMTRVHQGIVYFEEESGKRSKEEEEGHDETSVLLVSAAKIITGYA